MTSPLPTSGAAAPRYTCDRCGRSLTAAQALLAHVADPGARRPAICPGAPQPVSAVVDVVTASADTLPICRDDRAGVTLPIAVQLVGGDQLEAAPAGDRQGEADAGGGEGSGHETSIIIAGSERSVSAHAADARSRMHPGSQGGRP